MIMHRPSFLFLFLVFFCENHERACATVIPSRVVQGKLWLWPDSSPAGVEASEHVSPVVVPDLDSDDFGGNWYARDLAYGFDTLLENLAGEVAEGRFSSCAACGLWGVLLFI